MATIKSFTDLQQSKKLAEILPLESADMYYAYGAKAPDIMIGSKQDYRCYTMCWSLVALLACLPEYHLSSPNPLCSMYCCRVNDIATYANNPVDACCEMILKLNELNLL